MNSKYEINWEDYLEKYPELKERPLETIKPILEKYDDLMFNFIMNLLL